MRILGHASHFTGLAPRVVSRLTPLIYQSVKPPLIEVNEAEAEKIIERVQRKPLYFVYKTKLTVADKSYNSKTKQLVFHKLTFDQEFTSDVFIGP